MIDDGRRIPDGSILDCDICIVGAGAAGITLAVELLRTPASVVLLESGGRAFDRRTQALYEGEVADTRLHSPPHRYRRRQFGGTTTIWGGGCVPFDPIDFEHRAHVSHSGWPFGRDELERYYPRASELLEVGESHYDAAAALPGQPREIIPGFRSERVLGTLLERNSRPTNFARRYAAILRSAPRLRVLLHGNCTRLTADRDGAAIDHVAVATLAGNHFIVAARYVILATGGLEVPRLLLASRDVHPEGIGNAHDLVGRYYMRHLTGSVGTLQLNGPRVRLDYGVHRSRDGVYCRQLFSIAPEQQRELEIGNIIFRLWSSIADPRHRSGGLSAQFLAQWLLPYERKKWSRVQSREASPIPAHLRNVASDPVGVLAFAYNILSRRMLARREHPTVMVNPATNRYTFNFVAEQVPFRESRVRLSEVRDPLGMPRIHIDWHYTEQDVHTIRTAYRVLAEEIARSGCGSLDVGEEEIERTLERNGGFDAHHIGTTRMADDPAEGVVDRNCRVHGVRNLFIASSAVFPTSGHALPTLTIVALAVRLAAHVHGVLEAAARPVPVAAGPAA